jgi:hypothetical protein
VLLAGVAIAGAAFTKPLRWLVLPAVTLALSGGVVAAAGIDVDGGIGNREYRPASSADLHDHYQLGIGQLVIDLRDTDLPPGDVPVKLDVGIGEARVIVPDDVCVVADAEVGMGNVRFFGADHGGVDVDYEDAPVSPSGTTRLLLKGNVGIGELNVRDRRDDVFYDNFDPLDHAQEHQTTACSATGSSTTG